MTEPQPLQSGNGSRKPAQNVSGKFVVIALLILGLSATGLMFVYWDQHTRPFRSLRESIGREFRHSRPNVEGGRPKGRGPWTLRISMSVDFPPSEDSVRADEVAKRVLEITKQDGAIRDIDKLELNLIQFIPQETAKTRTLTWTADELKKAM